MERKHSWGKTVRLDPQVRFCVCDRCETLDHLRPYMDELLCPTCLRASAANLSWDWDDAA